MRAVEGRARMGGDLDAAGRLAALGVERIQCLAGCEPDCAAVIGDTVDAFHAGEGAVFADDFGWLLFHEAILTAKGGGGE